MYTNTDTKNQTRHMQEMARSFHPERIHFAQSFSDWEQALSHGSGLPLDTAQKPCDPSSVLEHIVLTSWHPRNQSVPASWYNVIWHCHSRNQSVPASWYNVTWHCHPRNQSVPASWYNVICHWHPRNQSVPASYRGAMSTVTTSHGMDPLWHLEQELWLTSSLWHLDDEQYWLVHSDILMRNSIN